MDFSKLKKRRGTTADSLAKKIDSMQGGGFKKDERIWKPERDKAGNASAVVRFLPISPEDMEIEGAEPFVRVWSHAFKGPGGWYIERSRTTLGKEEADPLSELNREQWDENNEKAKDEVRKRSRKLKYYANIYVVRDRANPENEGKVMLYEFGAKIFDKITQALKPKFEDDPKFDPFDLWEGANFKVKVFTEEKGSNKFPNYDQSEFDRCEPLFETDEELEAVWKKCYSLQEMLDEKHFKTYDQLKKRLEMVLKEKVGGNAAKDSEQRENAEGNSNKMEDTPSAPEPEQKEQTPSAPSSDEDDDMAFFDSLTQ